MVKGRRGPFGITPAVKRTSILVREEEAFVTFVRQQKPGVVLATGGSREISANYV